MKRNLITIGLLMTLGAASAQQGSLTDVPAGHWATDAIKDLQEEGVLLGYPDGTFRGTESLSRYEAAVIIARVLDAMRAGTTQIDPEMQDGMMQAIQELFADLAGLGVTTSDIAASFKAQQVQIDDLDARVESVEMNINALSDNQVALADAQNELLGVITEQGEAFEARANILEADQVALTGEISRLDGSFGALSAEQSRLAQDMTTMGVSGREATDQLGTRLSNLEQRDRVSIQGPVLSVTGEQRTSEGPAVDLDRLTQGTFAQGQHGDDDVKTVDGATDEAKLGAGLTLSVERGVPVTTGFGVNAARLSLGVDTEAFVASNADASAPELRVNSLELEGRAFDRAATGNLSWADQGVKYSKYLFDNDQEGEGDTDGVARSAVVRVIGEGRVPTITAFAARDDRAGSVVGSAYGVKAERGESAVGYVRYGERHGAYAATAAEYGPVKADAQYSAVLADGQDFGDREQAAELNLKAKTDLISAAAYAQAVSAGMTAQASGSNDRDKTVRTDTARLGGAAQVTLPSALGVKLGGYVDREAAYDLSDAGTSAGLMAALKVAGVDVTAFYNTSTAVRQLDSDNALTVLGHTLDAEQGVSGKSPVNGLVDAPFARGNNYGVKVGVNDVVRGLSVQGAWAELGMGSRDLSAQARYDAKLGGLNVSPFVRVRNYDARDTGFAGFTNVKFGAQASTEAGVLPLGAKLTGGLALRNQVFGDGAKTEERTGQLAVAFDYLFVDGLQASVGVTGYEGDGLSSPFAGNQNGGAYDVSQDAIYGGASTYGQSFRLTGAGNQSASLLGLYGQVGYRNLKFNVARYSGVAGGQDVKGTSFGASYTLKF